jgi:hypothetical protein
MFAAPMGQLIDEAGIIWGADVALKKPILNARLRPITPWGKGAMSRCVPSETAGVYPAMVRTLRQNGSMNHKYDELARGLTQPAGRAALERLGVHRNGVALGCCIAYCLVATVKAQSPVPGAFNTGVDDNGALLPAYTVDPHYQLIISPDPNFPGPDAVIVDDTLRPIVSGEWLTNTSISKWIAPQGDQNWTAGFGETTGFYTYRTIIDLTQYDPDLVFLLGQWSCESLGTDVQLNGLSTHNATSTNFYTVHVQWTPLFISTGFVPGTNTLDFVVNRVAFGVPPLPTGLQVQLNISNVPPPALQIGLSGDEVLVWWRTNRAAGFILESSDSLGAHGNWSALTGPTSTIGDQYVAVVDATAGSKFFRLRRP